MSDENTYTAMADKPLKELDFNSGYSIYVTAVSAVEFEAFLLHIRTENVVGLYRYFHSGTNTVRLDFLNPHDAFNYCRYVDLVTTLHKESRGAKQFLRVRYENSQSGTVVDVVNKEESAEAVLSEEALDMASGFMMSRMLKVH